MFRITLAATAVLLALAPTASAMPADLVFERHDCKDGKTIGMKITSDGMYVTVQINGKDELTFEQENYDAGYLKGPYKPDGDATIVFADDQSFTVSGKGAAGGPYESCKIHEGE